MTLLAPLRRSRIREWGRQDGAARWGVVGIATVAPLDRADVIVSDDGLTRDARQLLWEHVDEVVLAGSTADGAEVPSA